MSGHHPLWVPIRDSRRMDSLNELHMGTQWFIVVVFNIKASISHNQSPWAVEYDSLLLCTRNTHIYMDVMEPLKAWKNHQEKTTRKQEHQIKSNSADLDLQNN